MVADAQCIRLFDYNSVCFISKYRYSNILSAHFDNFCYLHILSFEKLLFYLSNHLAYKIANQAVFSPNNDKVTFHQFF